MFSLEKQFLKAFCRTVLIAIEQGLGLRSCIKGWEYLFGKFFFQFKYSDSYGCSSGTPKPVTKTQPTPRRSPPPPPQSEPIRSASPTPVNNSKDSGGALGAFWSTQHAKDSLIAEDQKGPKFDDDASRHDQDHPERQVFGHNPSAPKNVHVKSVSQTEEGGPSKDFEIKIFKEDSGRISGRKKTANLDSKPAFPNEAFNTFVAEFDTNKVSPGIESKKSCHEEELAAEVKRLKEELKQANMEKAEITSKYEKLSAICRSQRQEIQELKQDIAVRTQSPNREASKDQTSPSFQPKVTTVFIPAVLNTCLPICSVWFTGMKLKWNGMLF